MTQPDYSKEKGDFLEGQPQYEKYVKCHVYRIHPCTFGTTTTKGCGSTGGGDGSGSGGGGGGGGSCGGGTNNGCSGPGDPGLHGHGACFTFWEEYKDNEPCLDYGDLTPYLYCFDYMLGNSFIDFGSIDDPVTCT